MATYTSSRACLRARSIVEAAAPEPSSVGFMQPSRAPGTFIDVGALALCQLSTRGWNEHPRALLCLGVSLRDHSLCLCFTILYICIALLFHFRAVLVLNELGRRREKRMIGVIKSTIFIMPWQLSCVAFQPQWNSFLLLD